MRSQVVVCVLIAALACLSTRLVWAGDPSFIENKGQWHPNVLFKADLGGAFTYLDRDGITVLLAEEDFFSNLHDHVQALGTVPSGKMHGVKIRFKGMNFSSVPEVSGAQKGLYNYFLGNDSTKWATDVRAYQRVVYRDALPGIDVHYALKNGQVKYDFVVAPGVDPRKIVIELDGADQLRVDGGDLLVGTSVGTFKELAPFAFQRTEEGKVSIVPCEYRLKNNRVTYHFPEGYDANLPLVIDPELAFSTFIGSASSNFGFTASYDNQGNLYAGAIVFGDFYPVTPGAFQVSFAGADVDCGITKFSADGTELLYSTFLGGQRNEAPHSIVVSAAGEAYIFGTTGSGNFPTLFNAFQPFFAGGTNVTTSVGFPFILGSDLFVTKLNPTGNALLGSTYVGGSGNDGLSENTPFNFNYGDLFRGEIVIDAEGNAYVASVTRSANFPIVGGYSNLHSADLSGVIFKLSSNLSQMIWSTYSGGNGTESATSIQLAADNSVYVSGGTFSNNLATANAHQSNALGSCDGYVAHISADGGTLLACTYTGTSAFDLNYFVQIDNDGNIYVIGQTLGNYPVSAGVYQNPNSGQFIHKFTPNLETSLWSTVVGGSNGGVDLSPSAFLVSDCGQIYVAGWGGTINGAGGTTFGLPVTANAYQSTTDGNDFYIMVLGADASDLVYATFFGGSQSQEHVDGGTSRFDKNGTVYQAVCAGCGGNSDFPTQPGVWSQTNNASNCNLAVFKFLLSSVQSIAGIDAPDLICPGTQVNFINSSTDADTFVWNFGDGSSSTAFAPQHTFESAGTYEVWLYAESNDGCLFPDSTALTVEVLEAPNVLVEDPPSVCPGETVQLQASGANDYIWSPATDLDNAEIDNPVLTATATTTLSVTGTTLCGTQTVQVVVNVGSDNVEVSDDVAICPGEAAVLSASGATSYIWSPALGLNDANSASPSASPTETTVYTVIASTDDDCDASASVQVTVLPPPPILGGKTEYVSCNGASVQISITGAETYNWTPSAGLSNEVVGNPVAQPDVTTIYTVTGSNFCGDTEAEVKVLVNEITARIFADSLVCYGSSIAVSAGGGVEFIWQPADLFTNNKLKNTNVTLNESSTIRVTAFDEDGCFATAEKTIFLYPRPTVTAGRDRVISFGDEVQLESNSVFPIVWEESPFLSCTHCNFPVANPLETTTFLATIRSDDGCVERDPVTVFVRGRLYVPNAFTPDGDGLNDIFKAEGIDIAEFKMEIFDRWGKLVFESDNINTGWNGARLGSSFYCEAGVYPYRIVAREEQGDLFEYVGHVTLLR